MSGSLSILHTESSLGWGGQEIRVLSEAQGFIARGHKVLLACPPEARIFAEAPAWGVPVIGAAIGRKRLAGVRAMIGVLRQNRLDVVSSHSSTDSWLAALALLLLGRPVPLVRTRHISAPVSRGPLSRWLYGRASARIVTTGEALKRQLVEENGIPEARIDSVPTGIDSKRFTPGDRDAARAQLGLPRDKALVGIVATLRSWKGHRLLIEAIAGLGAGVELVMVGEGPMRDVLEADVEKLGLRSRARFAGNQRDVLPWLRALDVFALPSYANEGVPQALVQAMLTGLPCVTTHVGSIAELATHERTALVVPPKDALALRAAIQRLLDDRALGKRLGEAARAHCAAGYSYESMLDRMEAIYRQVSGVR
jgi:glycosyltransferase involved in cell wall biosynthesis